MLAALEQRIAVRYAMPGMTAEETAGYIRHHLKLRPRRAAFHRRRRRPDPSTSRGLPRAVNNLAIAALIAAYAAARTSSTTAPPGPPSPRSRQAEHPRDTLTTRPRPAPPGGAIHIMHDVSPAMTPPSSNLATQAAQAVSDPGPIGAAAIARAFLARTRGDLEGVVDAAAAVRATGQGADPGLRDSPPLAVALEIDALIGLGRLRPGRTGPG